MFIGQEPLKGDKISRVEWVYERLLNAIIEGELAPGTPLRHHDLSVKLGVSLIPIREAIRKLEMQRLVERIPNKGARVASISIDDVRDAYATRMALEGDALRKAMPNIDPASLAEMRRLRQEMVLKVRQDDSGFYELHQRLHFSIYTLSGSPWLLHTIEILWNHTERHRHLARRLKTFVDVHDDLHGHILDAIEARDVEVAMAALRRDLTRTSSLIVKAQSRSEPV